MSEKQGTIVQVMGPVVDVAFDGGALPELKEALEVELDGRREVMEVAQHVGGDTVRCIMLSPVRAWAAAWPSPPPARPSPSPWARACWAACSTFWATPSTEGPGADQREVVDSPPAPAFENQRPVVDIFETGIKVIDLLAPTPKAERSACSAAPAWARRCSSRS